MPKEKENQFQTQKNKIVIFGDLHFGNGTDIFLFINYQKKVFENVILPYLKEHQDSIERLIFLGDIFHKRKSVDIPIIEFSRWFFNSLRDFKIDIIIGNHDCYYKNTNEINSPQILLSSYKNITIHEEHPIEIGNILLVPWICKENMDICLDALKTSPAEIVCGHFEINNARLVSNVFCDFGMGLDMFERFKVVFSGHFHHRQHFANIIYTGCLWELRYEDAENEKGFYVIDYKEDGSFDFEFVPTTNKYKMFNAITYDEYILEKTKEAKKTSLDLLLPMEMKLLLEGTYVKVIYKTNKNKVLWEKFIERLNSFNPVEILYSHIEEKRSGEEDLLEEAVNAQNHDIMDVFKAVLKEDISDEEKRKKYLAFIHKLYQETEEVERLVE
ncbi:MAG: hypothetical protein N3A54_01415 [Patescibacteria group bacterium]|nr:hypothetical protein [Patescibacteria group bacterium]